MKTKPVPNQPIPLASQFEAWKALWKLLLAPSKAEGQQEKPREEHPAPQKRAS